MSALAVFRPRRLGRLFLSDAVNVGRDPMLMLATAMSVAPAVLLWAVRDRLDAAALAASGVARLSDALVPFALVLPSMLVGWVVGFLLLEDRDDGPLLALDVTPAGKAGFFAYRLAVAALITLAVTVLGLALLAPGLTPAAMAGVLLMVPAEAVLAGLVLPAVARNKVEGLALTKATNLLSLGTFLALIPSHLRYAGGILPSYWVGELVAPAGSWLPAGLSLLLGTGVHAAAGVLLLRLLGRRAG